MLGLVATLSSTHCPSHPLLHSGTPSPPVLTRWLPEHLFTLGDGPRCRVCPSASPFCPVGFPHSFASLLAGVLVEATPLRCREGDTPFNTPPPPIVYLLIYPFNSQTNTKISAKILELCFCALFQSGLLLLSPNTLVFSFVSLHCAHVMTYGSSLMASCQRWK